MWYRFLKYVLIGPWLRMLSRPKVEGLEYIPHSGPVIFAGNHLAFIDSFMLPLVSSRRPYFLAKSDYFSGKGIKGAFKRLFMLSVGQVPIDRTGADSAADALRAAQKILDKGHALGIYPEGTRSPDGRLYKGKTGVARIALETGVPIIPVAMIDTEKFNPPGTIIPRPRKVGIKIGEPIDLSRYDGMAGDRFIERAVTDEIMYALLKLSGQEYVDIYAADAKKGLTAATENFEKAA